MRVHHRLAALAFAGALLTGACSSSGAEESEPTADAISTTTAAADGGDIGEFCGLFAELADRREQGDDGPRGSGEFDLMLDTVERIAAVAPAEIADEADAYVEMVGLRAALSAENGGAGREELPADARAEFIADNADLQQEVDELIDYAQSTCEGF
jgi:hypothetical protein